MGKLSISLLALTLLLVAGYFVTPQLTGSTVVDRPTITIATWNIENFGAKKASNPDVMAQIADIIDDYDIVAIQEISNVNEKIDQGCSRNQDACPGPKCNLITDALLYNLAAQNYSILISEQVKDERYAFVFRNTSISLTDEPRILPDPKQSGHQCDLKPDDTGLMFRQPYHATFTIQNFTASLTTAHTSPSNNKDELVGLDQIFAPLLQQSSTQILLGDLNVDCRYRPMDHFELEHHIWLIPSSYDTTVSKTDCTYDQIIIPHGKLQQRFTGKTGVDTRVHDALSDHYLVWAEFYID